MDLWDSSALQTAISKGFQSWIERTIQTKRLVSLVLSLSKLLVMDRTILTSDKSSNSSPLNPPSRIIFHMYVPPQTASSFLFLYKRCYSLIFYSSAMSISVLVLVHSEVYAKVKQIIFLYACALLTICYHCLCMT